MWSPLAFLFITFYKSSYFFSSSILLPLYMLSYWSYFLNSFNSFVALRSFILAILTALTAFVMVWCLQIRSFYQSLWPWSKIFWLFLAVSNLVSLCPASFLVFWSMTRFRFFSEAFSFEVMTWAYLKKSIVGLSIVKLLRCSGLCTMTPAFVT